MYVRCPPGRGRRVDDVKDGRYARGHGRPTSSPGTMSVTRRAGLSHHCTRGKRWRADGRPWPVDGRGTRNKMPKLSQIVCTTRHCVQNSYGGHEGQPQRHLRRESLWNASDAPKSRPCVRSPAQCDGLKVLNPHQSNYGGRINRRDAFEGCSRPSVSRFVQKTGGRTCG